MEKEQFGLYISKLRKEKNLTQKELGERLYITDKAVSKWERGISYPDISVLDDLAAVLGVSTAELLSCGEKEEGSSLSMEEVNQLLEDSLKLSEEVIREKKSKTRIFFMLCIVVVLLIISILLNIINYRPGQEDINQSYLYSNQEITSIDEKGGDNN